VTDRTLRPVSSAASVAVRAIAKARIRRRKTLAEIRERR
jgi:hypothetical protein